MEKRLIGNSACKVDNKVFFTVYGLNVIGCLDLDSYIISYIFGPEEEMFAGNMLWGDIIGWKDALIIEPYMAENVWLYDMRLEKWKKLITSCDLELYTSNKFSGIHIFNDLLYLVGHTFSNILCFDLVSSKYNKILDEEDIDAPKSVRFFGQSMAIKGESLYIANELSNHIVIVNVKDGSYRWDRLGSDERKNRGIIYDGDFFWIIPTSGKDTLIKWNESSGKIYEYELISEMTNIWGAGSLNDNVYLYGPSDRTFVFNTKSCEVKKFEFDIRYMKSIDGTLFMCEKSGKMVIDDGLKRSYVDTRVDDVVLNQYIKDHASVIRHGLLNKVVNETETFGASNWINMIL